MIKFVTIVISGAYCLPIYLVNITVIIIIIIIIFIIIIIVLFLIGEASAQARTVCFSKTAVPFSMAWKCGTHARVLSQNTRAWEPLEWNKKETQRK